MTEKLSSNDRALFEAVYTKLVDKGVAPKANDPHFWEKWSAAINRLTVNEWDEIDTQSQQIPAENYADSKPSEVKED